MLCLQLGQVVARTHVRHIPTLARRIALMRSCAVLVAFAVVAERPHPSLRQPEVAQILPCPQPGQLAARSHVRPTTITVAWRTAIMRNCTTHAASAAAVRPWMDPPDHRRPLRHQVHKRPPRHWVHKQPLRHQVHACHSNCYNASTTRLPSGRNVTLLRLKT